MWGARAYVLVSSRPAGQSRYIVINTHTHHRRDLPQIGHKGWQTHFEAAFNAYTQLWRFQQQYRHILDSKYDLKRWQIGEIASKIGQLYYHYYLRTSECAHLLEACNFYAAIRARGYFNLFGKDVRQALVIKRLRYYARYIVVCLLLKRVKLVKELVREFNQALNEHSHVYEPEAQLEWSLVLQEIKAFIDAESIVAVVSGMSHADGPGVQLTLSQRLTSTNIPAPLKMPTGKLFLAEALIVGNNQRQVKFSELTVDMYRLLQILEREPNEQQQQLLIEQQQQQQLALASHANASPNHHHHHQVQDASATKSFNLLARPTFNSNQRGGPKGSPHKYLLFRPTFSQLLLFLAAGFKELPANGVLLLYLSADGSFGPLGANMSAAHAEYADEAGYELGGVATNPGPSASATAATVASNATRPGSSNATASGRYSASLRGSQSMHFKQLNCLHPGDLYPFTRKPLVIVVDSNNSYAFQHMPRHFGLPVLVLMSPAEYPAPFNDNTKGSLFTLFLHCPITALCLISNIIELPESIWREAQFYLDKFYTELSQIILQSRLLDPSFIGLCSDDFLRLLIFRFIFSFTIMRLHRLFRTSNYYPRSYPPIPETELIQHPVLKQIISDLTVTLDIRTLFD